MRKFILSLAFALSIAACGSDDSQVPESSALDRSGPRTWVAIEPVQCFTNAWEADWLAHHNDDRAKYPRDLSAWPRALTPQEIQIITAYYAKQGVVVFETATRAEPRTSTPVCAACICEEGHTLFLLVRDRDLAEMIALGYRVEAPQS